VSPDPGPDSGGAGETDGEISNFCTMTQRSFSLRHPLTPLAQIQHLDSKEFGTSPFTFCVGVLYLIFRRYLQKVGRFISTEEVLDVDDRGLVREDVDVVAVSWAR
jgi:hypothetical protein